MQATLAPSFDMTSTSKSGAGVSPGVGGCTCFKLRGLTRRVTALYDRALAPSGINVNQYSLLAHLAGANAVSVSGLAVLLAADRTTVTRNLQPLLAAGYVEVGLGANARTRALSITHRGKAVLAAARPFWKSAQRSMRDVAGETALAALHKLVDVVSLRLSATHGPDHQGKK